MPVDRILPTEEAQELLGLVRELVRDELRPASDAAEAEGRFPRELIATLGEAGLLGLPYPEESGGGGQPYEVYLQVVEELAAGWATIGETVSVHTLACFPLAEFGTDEQRQRWLPEMIGGGLLGGYCLSESQSGSDAAAMRTRAERQPDGLWVVNGTKAWITHGGVADFYSLFARTGGDGAHGISCFLVPGDADGLSSATPERKMGFKASPTAQVTYDGVRLGADRLLGDEGAGFKIALRALDSGRLGIAACAVGLAQAAFDAALAYAREREQFGRPILDNQAIGFLFADLATAITAARELYLAAARRRDAGRDFSQQAAMAKLFASDTAMRVATDAVQVLGGYGYTADFPVERYFREAKAFQIVEGTNQVQRLVISRSLQR
ncbi:MAG: acyl-CoA dehydrogenase family protein [Actinomycetes bacterium]